MGKTLNERALEAACREFDADVGAEYTTAERQCVERVVCAYLNALPQAMAVDPPKVSGNESFVAGFREGWYAALAVRNGGANG